MPNHGKVRAQSRNIAMNTLSSEHSPDSGTDVDDYSGVVLSSNTAIRQLRDVARRLTQQDDSMLDPEFFLASVSKGWKPRVVAVYGTRGLVGIMYAKERVISDLVPTGVVYADGSLGGMLLVNPSRQQDVFRTAVDTLLATPGIRSVRLRLPQHSETLGGIRQLTASRPVDAHYFRLHYRPSPLWKHHAHLSLSSSYEQFLKRLGSTTRHNFRYYRRQFEASGHTFVESLSIDELRDAALDLAVKSKLTTPQRQSDIAKGITLVATARRPLAIGLKHHNGEWLSILGGWYKPGGAVLLFQCNNDRDFGRESLSVVLRAYCIEHLIVQGLKELVIWADTGPPLSRYVTYAPSIGVQLDAPTYPWRFARFLLSTVGPWLPKRLAAAAQWLACFVITVSAQNPEGWLINAG
jgi:hypothetical protein